MTNLIISGFPFAGTLDEEVILCLQEEEDEFSGQATLHKRDE